jgi:hypothetical protein
MSAPYKLADFILNRFTLRQKGEQKSDDLNMAGSPCDPSNTTVSTLAFTVAPSEVMTCRYDNFVLQDKTSERMFGKFEKAPGSTWIKARK